MVNFYNPVLGLFSKLSDNQNITQYSIDKNIFIYYPKNFIKPSEDINKKITIMPFDGSKEYFNLTFFKLNESDAVESFIKKQENNLPVYNLKNYMNVGFSNDAYINFNGSNAYIKLDNNIILKISYIADDYNNLNLAATFSMIIKSLSIFN